MLELHWITHLTFASLLQILLTGGEICEAAEIIGLHNHEVADRPAKHFKHNISRLEILD
jgi:hypothetical protein